MRENWNGCEGGKGKEWRRRTKKTSWRMYRARGRSILMAIIYRKHQAPPRKLPSDGWTEGRGQPKEAEESRRLLGATLPVSRSLAWWYEWTDGRMRCLFPRSSRNQILWENSRIPFRLVIGSRFLARGQSVRLGTGKFYSRGQEGFALLRWSTRLSGVHSKWIPIQKDSVWGRFQAKSTALHIWIQGHESRTSEESLNYWRYSYKV